MAIDPKLVSIKTAAQLPSGIPTASGEFLYFEDETLKKAEMSDLYDRLESAYLGIITPSSTIPATGSWYGTVLEAGTFNNVTPAITVDAADFDEQNGIPNNEVRIIISEGVSTKDVRRVKGDAGVANPVFNPENNTEAPTMKGVNDYFVNENEEINGIITMTDSQATNGQMLISTTLLADEDDLIKDITVNVPSAGTILFGIGELLFSPTRMNIIKSVGTFDAEIGINTFEDVNVTRKAGQHLVAIGGTSNIGYDVEGSSSLDVFNSSGAYIGGIGGYALSVQLTIDTNPINLNIEDRIAQRVTVTDRPNLIEVHEFSDVTSVAQAVAMARTMTGNVFIETFGEFEESVNLYNLPANLKVSLISKYGATKIIQNTGDYYSPPLQVNGNFYGENLILIATEEDGLANPSAYSTHVDVDFNLAGGGVTDNTVVHFKGCQFIQEVSNQHCFGAGLWQGTSIILDDCDFRKLNSASDASALYVHNATAANKTLQRLVVSNSRFYANGGPLVMIGDVSGVGASECEMTFINNTNMSVGLADPAFVQNIPASGPDFWVGKIKLGKSSHGNNMPTLNY